MERASVHSAMKRLSRLTLKVVALPGGIHGYRTTRDGLRQLAQEMCKRPDSLDHLTAKAEMARRAAVQDRRRSWIMLASAVIAAIRKRRSKDWKARAGPAGQRSSRP